MSIKTLYHDKVAQRYLVAHLQNPNVYLLKVTVNLLFYRAVLRVVVRTNRKQILFTFNFFVKTSTPIFPDLDQ